MEKRGPFGDEGAQTSNRAELRAIIAALGFRHWPGEGFHTCVIGTDSEYVVEGATLRAKSWIERGWKTRAGTDVKNRDLWEALLGEVERWTDDGLDIKFWKMPREWNTVADAAANRAAAGVEAPNHWREVIGFNF